MATFRGWPDSRRDPAPMQGPGGWPAVGNMAGWPSGRNTYSRLVLATAGLKGYWPLDELATVSTADRSTAARATSKTGTITQEADPIVPGYKSNSCSGGAAYYTATGVATTVVNNWTLEAWLACTTPQKGGIIYVGTDSSNGYGMSIGSAYGVGRSPVYLFGGVVWEAFYTAPAVAYELPLSFTGQMVYVRRSGTIYLYINGALVATGVTNTPNTPTGNTILGRMGGANNMPYTGRMAHLGIYDVALTDRQIRQRYQAGRFGVLEQN